MSPYAELLDLIRKGEVRGYAKKHGLNEYDVVYSGIALKDRPKSLRKMTIREVLAWQDSIDKKYNSEAAGAYQIMEDTLRDGLVVKANLSMEDLFDEDTQDMLATALLFRRGLHQYLRGEISAEAFCNNLAHEWASLPQVSGKNKGKGVYDGDGMNKANPALADEFLAVVKRLKRPKVVEAKEVVVAKATTVATTVAPDYWPWIIGAGFLVLVLLFIWKRRKA